MALARGQTLSHYEVLDPLGAGGMGEVWRARDSRLEREVAIKVLPDALATDQDRLKRFEREARTLASLNHPHVAGIYGLDQQEETRFIAMELVPGEDLAQRIERGPLPVGEALGVCGQIADGLAAAHAAGVVHRDLKPANVRVTPAGVVKLLDFGIAKPVERDGEDETGTRGLALTEEGLVLGTPVYMSPEQARGHPVDRRTDAWAFGCVLYECLTGERAFHGGSLNDVLAAVIGDEPDWKALPVRTPAHVRRLLQRCLTKDPEQRLADLGEARDVLLAGGGRRWPALLVAVAVVAALGMFLWSGGDDARSSAREGDGARAAARGIEIAVLPFPGSDGPDEFGEGLSDEIITELSRYHDLRVISRTQSKQLAGQGLDVNAISSQLGGVRYVVEGRVRRSPSEIRVDAWLTDAVEGHEVWSDQYHATLSVEGLFDTQEELTLKIVNALATGHGELSRAELARTDRALPSDLDAYACVLEAYRYWHSHSPQHHFEARACLEETVARDPEYSEAVALLAYMYAEEFHHGWNERAEQYDALERGIELARKALRVDPSSQVAHGVLALIYSFQGDRERFFAEANAAIELNPGNADWLGGMGVSYAQMGYFEEGTELVRQALELNPNPMPWLYMAFFLDDYANERYAQALQEALRTDTTDFRTALFRAAAYGQLGERDKARTEVEALRSDPAADTIEEMREFLVHRNGYEEELAEHLFDGLRKAGFE